MNHYTTLLDELRGPFQVIVDKTWEDIPLADLFDTATDPETGMPYYDVEEMARQINRGDLDYFMLRVRVLFDGHELAAEHVGGFLYEDAREVLRDGTAEDMISSTVEQAQTAAANLFHKLQQLDEAMG
jgi:hypothetical protein